MSFLGSWRYKALQVTMLDGTDLARSIYSKTKAKELVDNILQMLNIVEKDYFGLYYMERERERYWLKLNERVWPQIKHLDPPYQLYFGMQYYPYDPTLLKEEVTTYQVYLQLRKDVIEGRIVASDSDRAEMCAYILQAEKGTSHESYIHKHRTFFVHLQRSSPELETHILELSDSLSSMDNIASEAKLIERALPAVQYGLEPYPVCFEAQPNLKGLLLTVGPVGLTIYQEYIRGEIYGWTEIWNAGYMNRTFWIRILRDGENARHKYLLQSDNVCKKVWKEFKYYFKFYCKDHSPEPKVMWGRTAPKFERKYEQDENFGSPIRNDASNPILTAGTNPILGGPTTVL